MLLHQWIYPTLYLTLPAYSVQREELQHIIEVVKLALGVSDFGMTIPIHTLPIKEGGSGLWEPKLYCHWVGSLAFVRFLWDNHRYGPEVRDTMHRWMHKYGIHSPIGLPLPAFQLAPWLNNFVPLLSKSARSLSVVLAPLNFEIPPHFDFLELPLWHCKIFSTATRKPQCAIGAVRQGVLKVKDVWLDGQTYPSQLAQVSPSGAAVITSVASLLSKDV